MIISLRRSSIALVALATLALAPSAIAEPPGPPSPPVAGHPGYLRALADLRNARANLERKGGDAATHWDEAHALDSVDRAMADIKQAAIDDGKTKEDHAPVDAREPRAGRLRRALYALKAASDDVAAERDDLFARGLRTRAKANVDEAIRMAEQGVVEAERGPVAVTSVVDVVAGTYGGNCGQARGNKTSFLAAACNGKTDCVYIIDYTAIGDPANGCAKDYVAEWRCGTEPTIRRASATPEAGYKKTVELACPQ
jgi:hypothetical protein